MYIFPLLFINIRLLMYTGFMGERNYGSVHWAMKFLWSVARGGVSLLFHRNTIRVNALEKRIKGPAVIVCNHVSMFDWYFVSQAVRHSPFHMVMGRYFLGEKRFDNLMKVGGVIPKAVFAHDNASAIASMRALRRGAVLAVFPEARLGVSGRLESIPLENIAMLKRLALPVYGVHIDGASLMNPKWGHRRDGALVEVSAKQLFDGETLSKASLQDVEAALYRYVWFDDYAFLERHPEVHYRCKSPAEKLENAAWVCPGCGKEFTLKSKGATITCSECGFTAVMDDRFRLSRGPATAQGWYDLAVDHLYQEAAAAGDAFRLASPVTLKVLSHAKGKGQREAGEGTCILDRNGLSYRGTMDGRDIRLDFPLEGMYVLPFGSGKNWISYDDKTFCYIFCPEEPRSCTKWYVASACLKGIPLPQNRKGFS